MRWIATMLLILMVSGMAEAQLTVTGTNPADGSTNVSTNIVLSISFSAAVDTLSFLPDDGLISNVDSVLGMYWSADARTVYFPAVLQPNTVYFLVLYYAPAQGGGSLQVPYAVHWTTGSSFPANVYSVSGTVSGGTTGVSPANALVALTDGGVSAGDPIFIAGTVADGSGNFTIPYVPTGTWDPVAAKDANGDGRIDPSTGDPIGTASSVVVASANVSGVTIVLQLQQAIEFGAARDDVLAYAQASLPANRELKWLNAWKVDSLGRAFEWNFYYTVPGTPEVTRVRADGFGVAMETRTGDWDYVIPGKPILDIMTAALADTFIAKVERSGGFDFRQTMPPGDTYEFLAQVELGDLQYSQYWQLIPDTSKLNWGASYWIGSGFQNQYPVILDERHYVGEYLTGDLVGITAVDSNPNGSIPGEFSLGQNYPNPFNPSTTIRYQLSHTSDVLLTVFDMLGREVALLVNEKKDPGAYSVSFDGAGLPSGVYFYRLQAGSRVQTMKMLLMK
jgi:hypothetical protein